jgi:hypothetical protein
VDGRNYTIQVDRPRVIEDYQKDMGYVDRHNRYRQNILGVVKLWRTKKWQVRVILEVWYGIGGQFPASTQIHTKVATSGHLCQDLLEICHKWPMSRMVVGRHFHNTNVSKF